MILGNLYDFSDAFVVLERTVTVAEKTFVANDFMDLVENRRVTSATYNNAIGAALDGKLAFKKNAPFFNSVSKVNAVLSANTDDLDVVIPIYSLPDNNKN